MSNDNNKLFECTFLDFPRLTRTRRPRPARNRWGTIHRVQQLPRYSFDTVTNNGGALQRMTNFMRSLAYSRGLNDVGLVVEKFLIILIVN